MISTEQNIQAAFVVILPMGDDRERQYLIGLAHAGISGYSKGYGECYNINYPGVKAETYDEASEWVESLNKSHYGHTPKEAGKIVMSSMFPL